MVQFILEGFSLLRKVVISFCYGLYDSLLFVDLFRCISASEKVKKTMKTVVIFNGVVFLGSVLIVTYILAPMVHFLLTSRKLFFSSIASEDLTPKTALQTTHLEHPTLLKHTHASSPNVPNEKENYFPSHPLHSPLSLGNETQDGRGIGEGISFASPSSSYQLGQENASEINNELVPHDQKGQDVSQYHSRWVVHSNVRAQVEKMSALVQLLLDLMINILWLIPLYIVSTLISVLKYNDIVSHSKQTVIQIRHEREQNRDVSEKNQRLHDNYLLPSQNISGEEISASGRQRDSRENSRGDYSSDGKRNRDKDKDRNRDRDKDRNRDKDRDRDRERHHSKDHGKGEKQDKKEKRESSSHSRSSHHHEHPSSLVSTGNWNRNPLVSTPSSSSISPLSSSSSSSSSFYHQHDPIRLHSFYPGEFARFSVLLPSRVHSASSTVVESAVLAMSEKLYRVPVMLFHIILCVLLEIIPVFGRPLAIILTAIGFSADAFEYRFAGVPLSFDEKCALFETRLPYFLGFGMPLSLLTYAFTGY